MLQLLQINNVALIEKTEVEFNEGLNILTGETGAGKSIIIDSINAILGSRVSKELIRSGEEKATVQAIFDANQEINDYLIEIGIEPEEDNTLVVFRQISNTGKNICRVNANTVPVSVLKALGERLIDIHGQYDNQSLLRTETHILLLDLFAGEKLSIVKQKYKELLEKRKIITNKLDSLIGNEKERERTIDLLKFQINEIEEARLKDEEDITLEQDFAILDNTEKIAKAFTNGYSLISGEEQAESGAIDLLDEAVTELNLVSQYKQEYKELENRVQDVLYQLQDVLQDIRHMKEGIEFDPQYLMEIEQRLNVINLLKKKYGNSIQDIKEYCQKCKLQLEEIENSEEIIATLKKELKTIEEELSCNSVKMDKLRCEASKIIEKKVVNELNELEMKKADFKVDIKFDQNEEFGVHGQNTIEFLISPNNGEPLKPLSKIASGGEMSRIMLAIKCILASIDSIPTMIFDEIDTGVSGKAAQRVGEKLSKLSSFHQVICITHHAQIASLADTHFYIEKEGKAKRTITKVTELDEQNCIKELARLLGGENITSNTINLAKEIKQKGLETILKIKGENDVS